MNEWTRRIKQYIEDQQMLETGDGVLTALSGGADSVCLLLVMKELAAAAGWQVRALHVHHGLRGAEADRDEAFVRALCEEQGIPLTVCHYQVDIYAKEHRLSVEEAGRKLRYEALWQAAEAWEREWAAESEQFIEQEQERSEGLEWSGGQDCTKRRVRIAVAHHMDDQAETVLHHMLRGSGLRGLTGMLPVQDRRIRPLLCVRREEILAYLKGMGQSWVEDSTNQHEEYTRNRIRQQIIPYMTEEINSHAVENIVRAASMIGQADMYLMEQAGRVMEEAGVCCDLDPERKSPVRVRMPIEPFLKEPEILQSCMVRKMLDLTARHQKDLTSEHFRQVIALAKKQVGAHLDLPGGLMAERTYLELCVSYQDPEAKRQKNRRIPEQQVSELRKPQQVSELRKPQQISELWKTPVILPMPDSEEKYLKMQVFSRQKGMEFPKNQYTKWFDYDKIKDTLSVRTRQNGDFITLAGGGQKTVNRYMIDEKIPKEKRDTIMLLTEGSHVLWIIGYRISEYYKITPQTRQVLEVSMNGGEKHV